MILAALNLLFTLVVSGGLAVYVRRTLRERAVSPTELLARVAELEAEWVSTLDMLTKQIKKLSKRERDAMTAQAQEPAPTGWSKDEARRALRAAGRLP